MGSDRQNIGKILKKVVKALLIALAVVLLLVVLAVGAGVWILTPERLTPLVNKYATEQINGRVDAARVELSFWSTFPRLTVDVDSLEVVSHALHALPKERRAAIPAYADSLLSLRSLHAGIDVLSLMVGKIALYDVELRHPRVNLVQADSVTANYMIVTPETEKKDEEKLPLVLPDISINRFAILEGFPIRYVGVADTIVMEATISEGTFSGDDNPVYRLEVNGKGGSNMSEFNLPPTVFGINGNLRWHASDPGAVELRNLTVNAEKVALTFDADIRMLDTLAVNALTLTAKDVALMDAVRLIPEQYRGELKYLSTDLKASLKAELKAPYIPMSGKIPPVSVDFKMPRGALRYRQLQLKGLAADISAYIDPLKPDRSIVNVRDVRAKGKAIDFSLNANVKNPISDPSIDGEFNGTVDFSRFPSTLTSRLPAIISGQLTGRSKFKFRQSYLNGKYFHKARFDGELILTNFNARMRDGSCRMFTRKAVMKLGTSSNVKVNGASVDSLLTASLKIDTVSASIPGLTLSGSGISMGVGAKNLASSQDSTIINPIGASVKAHRIILRTDNDSVRVRLTDAMVRASLQRYNNNARAPLLKCKVDMGRMRIADRYNRFSLRDASASVTLHPRTRPRMSRRMQARFDSIASAHPELSPDSVMSLARKQGRRYRRRASVGDGSERIDFGVDNSLRSWLRLWRLEGRLSAKRAHLFTPYFPVRNRITNLDLTFSTDSLHLRDTRYKMGKSDFLINGTVSNISRALTSRRGAPLRISLDIRSDTLNVNEITRALMRGSAFAERLAAGTAHMPDSENDQVMTAAMEQQVDAEERAAVVIPSNIEASMSIKAGVLQYSDILFRRFTGGIEVANGQAHLSRLGAFTPMGSFGLTALYSAPDKQNIRFAGGMVVRKLDLRQFLDMLPEIDTIMPMLRTMEGIITAEAAMTTELDTLMNLKFHTLDMALKISGDSLVLLDSKTFKTVSKWLLFKNKKRNMIDSISAEMIIRDNKLQLYPFMVNLDRYRFGISGTNDAALNLKYHIAVLKSPIPFKFGINISGTPEKLKIRLGRAKFNEKEVTTVRQMTDTVRINLIREIQRLFRIRKNDKNAKLKLREPEPINQEFSAGDTISATDSVFFIRQGIIPAPKGWVDPDSIKAADVKSGKKKKRK